MTGQEWLYDCRHILKKLKDGADFVNDHALISLHQYRERIVLERLMAGMTPSPVLYQREILSLTSGPLSDDSEISISSSNISSADIPQTIGELDKTLKVYSSSGQKLATLMDQHTIAMIIDNEPYDYKDYNFYFLSGNRIYYYPKTDKISIVGIFSNPFDLHTKKALILDGETISEKGTKRALTMYDNYPFDLFGMVHAIKLFISEKFGVSMNLIEDYIADNEDQLKVIKSGQK